MKPAINLDPSPRVLRQFGGIGFGAFAVLALLAQNHWGIFSSLPATAVGRTTWILAALSLYCGLAAAVRPHMLWPLYILLTVVGYPIGWVASLVVTGIVYYLVMTPIGLVFRLMGRDLMDLRFDASAKSYWIRRPSGGDVKRYFRQF